MSLLVVWVILYVFITRLSQTEAMKASPHTFVVTQDEEDIILKIKGDEDDHWITNQHDFTVVRDQAGRFEFATLSSDEERLVSSGQMADNHLPKHTKQKNLRGKAAKKEKALKKGKERDSAGSTKKNAGWNSSSEDKKAVADGGSVASASRTEKSPNGRSRDCASSCEMRADDIVSNSTSLTSIFEPNASRADVSERSNPRDMTSKSIGTLKNLVVLIRFQDHEDRELPSREDVAVLMNSDTANEELAPTGSLKMLYRESSHGQLTIESEITEWILLDNTEAYYADGQSGTVEKFHEALKHALDDLEATNFPFDDFDVDSDHKIDSISFLTSGYGAEWGADDVSGATVDNRIWSHKWSISGGWVSSRTGVRVKEYFVSTSLWSTSGKDIARVGAIAHEIGHYLDLPDLYDTDDSPGKGLGYFCMMGNAWGFDGSQLHPPEFSAWTKLQLGWTASKTPVVGVENRVSRSGRNPTQVASDKVYKIGDGVFGFPAGEYLLIEYLAIDSSEGGIAIYHVDEQSGYNTEGYPDQIDGGIRWPYNGNHYKIALMPADREFGLERGTDSGDPSDLYTFGRSLSPGEGATGPFPNTDSYQNGIVKRTGVRVCVTSRGGFRSHMAFLFADGTPAQQPWTTRLLETFEDGRGGDSIAFESTAKVVKNRRCLGSHCASLNTSSASMSVVVETVCLTELKASFRFYPRGLKRKDQIVLEYATQNDDGGIENDEWTLLKAWTKGKGDGEGGFRNRKWTDGSAILALPVAAEASSPTAPRADPPSKRVLRFRSTSSSKRFLVDDVRIEGRF